MVRIGARPSNKALDKSNKTAHIVLTKQGNNVMAFRVFFIDRFGYVQVHNVSARNRESVERMYAGMTSLVIKAKRRK